MSLAGKTVAVLGLGASGLGAARLAASLGASVSVFDSGSGPKMEQAAAALRAEGITVHLGATAGEKFDLGVLSPGIDPVSALPSAFTAAGTPVIGEIEFAWQHQKQPVVAITGTNGKSTTTELIALLLNAGGLRTLPCGNHGRAFSDVVQASVPREVNTVEVSSFQLETITTFHPRVAVWMNFAPDHLDRHPTLQAYFDAKARIFENQTADDWAVVKLEDDRPKNLKAQTLTFSAYSDGGDFALQGAHITFRGEKVLDYSAMKLRGRHNAENLMAALAAGRAYGISWETMAAAAADYRAPRHRCELVAVVDGREFIDDSKATNLHALESCLRSLPGPLVLIAGGKDKGLDFAPMRDTVAACASHVLAIGQLRGHLQEVWGSAVTVEPCDDLPAAVRRGHQIARPGQIVLLSPGTSSFDMFTSYEHRAQVFIDSVNALLSKA